jgi:hypothetical protein
MKAAERRSFWEYLHEGPRDVVQLAATFAARVTVARDGTLIVRLSWDIAQGRLSLSVLDGRLNPRTGDPPIIATQPVEAGSGLPTAGRRRRSVGLRRFSASVRSEDGHRMIDRHRGGQLSLVRCSTID